MSFINQPGNLNSAPKADPSVIKYSGGVVSRSGESGGIFKNLSEVFNNQKLFQSNKEFVHLKTPRDKMVYKYAMIGSIVGLGIASYGLWTLARPKKN